MCGIVGLFLKNPALEAQLGSLFEPMLVDMTERGPDSTGIAVYRDFAPDDAIKMKGPELFKIAVKSMEEVSRDVAARAGIDLAEVNLIVPHQANLRIINAVAERLGLPPEKVFTNIDRYGNTSAASVPIALDEALETGRMHDSDLIMLCACGGGLTWGANILRW